MSWTTTPVQQKSAIYDGVSNALTTTPSAVLDAAPAVGNLLVAVGVTSNSFAPVNDGWVLDPTYGSQAQFAAIYLYYRVVEPGDDLTALRTFTRTLSVSDRTALWVGEFTGAGPWTSATVLDKAIANSLTIESQTISTGTTPSFDQPDGLAIAAFGMPRIATSGTGQFTGYTNSFTELVEVGTVGGDAPDMAIAIKDIGNTVAAAETTATVFEGGSIAPSGEQRPMGLLFVFKTNPPVTIVPKLSGGSSNADPNLSIGGTRSSVVAPLGTLHDVSRLQADAVGGHTDYKLVYLHNIPNLRSLSAGVKVYVPQQPTVGTIAIGIATEAAGVTVTAVANETTAPAGVSFSSPSVIGSALDAGTIGPDAARGLWIRRTIPRFSSASASNPGIIRFNATPL